MAASTALSFSSQKLAVSGKTTSRRPVRNIVAHARPTRWHLFASAAESVEREVDSEAAAVWKADWPMHWSLASYEDLSEKCAREIMQDMKLSKDPNLSLGDVMSTDIATVAATVSVTEVMPSLRDVSGMPVVDDSERLVGVISRKDVENKEGERVGDIMSTPPLAVDTNAKVKDAAMLMLKHKVHRLPIVDNQAKVVGLVCRTDIFS